MKQSKIFISSSSLLSLLTSCIVYLYLVNHKCHKKTGVSVTERIQRQPHPKAYFIVQSYFMSTIEIYDLLDSIRRYDDKTPIILISRHPDYDLLFKKGYHLLGLINPSQHWSPKAYKKQIDHSLDGIFRLFPNE